MKTIPSQVIYLKEDYAALLEEIKELESSNRKLKEENDLYIKTLEGFKEIMIMDRYEIGEEPLLYLNHIGIKPQIQIYSRPKQD